MSPSFVGIVFISFSVFYFYLLRLLSIAVVSLLFFFNMVPCMGNGVTMCPLKLSICSSIGSIVSGH